MKGGARQIVAMIRAAGRAALKAKADAARAARVMASSLEAEGSMPSLDHFLPHLTDAWG